MQQQQQPSITTPRTPPQTPSQHTPTERELPMLAGIGAFVTWCEDLLAVLSGPILTAGLAIALIDLLSDGQLFTRVPMLLWVWAGSMALGLDAQFIGSSAKLARAMRHRRPWVATGYMLLCLALGYVAFLATYVFAVQEANGISTTEALSRLGMDSTTWIFQRSVLAVILVFLSGLLRYVPPAVNVAADTTEERERLLAEIELEPLRAQKRAMQLRGMRGAVLAGLGREQPAPSSQTMKPHIVTASSTLPPGTPPKAHQESAIATYRNEHDIDWVDLPDGVLDEAEYTESIYATRNLPEVRKPTASQPKGVREYSSVEAQRGYDLEDIAEDDDGEDYPTDSRHQRKKGKTATGRMNQRQRKAKLARQNQERQEARERDSAIDRAVALVGARLLETGEQISGYELEDRVNEALERTKSSVRTTRKTVMKKLADWMASQGVNTAADEVEPMEPEELDVLQEAW